MTANEKQRRALAAVTGPRHLRTDFTLADQVTWLIDEHLQIKLTSEGVLTIDRETMSKAAEKIIELVKNELPDPVPEPEPDGLCQHCDGSGYLQPAGEPCPACNADSLPKPSP